jgi:hypothetical protein
MGVTKTGPYSWKVTTDEKHVIIVDSILISSEWEKSAAYAGQKVFYLIYTSFVGHGSPITVRCKTSSGKTLADEVKLVYDNYLRDSFLLPAELGEDETIYLEVESIKKNLHGTSKPIPVRIMPLVRNLKWSKDEVEHGTELTLTADVYNVKDETPAIIKIYEYDPDGGHERLTEFTAWVKSKKISPMWQYRMTMDASDYPTREECAQFGVPYDRVKYFFTVTVGTTEFGKEDQASGFIKFQNKSVHVLEFEDMMFRPKSAVLMPDRADMYDFTIKPGSQLITGISSIAVLLLNAKKLSDHKMLIIGHTDAAVDEKLSLERAYAVLYLAKGDKDAWAKHADKNCVPQDIQHLLKWTGYDPGAVDGEIGPNTKKQIKAFQIDAGLKDDGEVGPKTWGAFYDRYDAYLKKYLSKIEGGEAAYDARKSLSPLDSNKEAASCSSYTKSDLKDLEFRSKTNARIQVLFFYQDEAPGSCPCKEKNCKKESCAIYHEKKGYRPLCVNPLDEAYRPAFKHNFSD